MFLAVNFLSLSFGIQLVCLSVVRTVEAKLAALAMSPDMIDGVVLGLRKVFYPVVDFADGAAALNGITQIAQFRPLYLMMYDKKERSRQQNGDKIPEAQTETVFAQIVCCHYRSSRYF